MTSVSYDDFSKIDLRVGKIENAEEVAGSEKLIKMEIDFGDLGRKIIFAGIRKWYQPDDLKEKLFIFVYNLEPKKIMGEESQGMILAAEEEGGENCVLLVPDKNIPPGTKVF